MTPYPVYVEWCDSASISGWGEHTQSGTDTCRSFGWLVHQTNTMLVLSTSLNSDGERSIDRLAIPRRAVTHMHRVPNKVKRVTV